MNKQVLTTEQMKSLIKLGIDYGKASMCECISSEGKQILIASDSLSFLPDKDKVTWTVFKVFTLQDIIEILPDFIITNNMSYDFKLLKSYNRFYYESGETILYDSLIDFADSMITSAYNTLVWVLENGHLKIK